MFPETVCNRRLQGAWIAIGVAGVSDGVDGLTDGIVADTSIG